jgi:hypothetical protein
MNRRRTIRPLGAAAFALLGAAFLPGAVAAADDYTFVPEPGTEEVTGFFGLLTAPPAVGGSVQSTGLFDFHDLTDGGSGTVNADASLYTDPFGDSNQELLVTSGTGADVPSDGSVFDTFTLGFGTGFQNIYSAIPTTGGADAVSDTVVTPVGDLSIPFPFFDAATVPGSDVGTSALADLYGISPVGTESTSAITGDPPLDVAVQGSQTFETAAEKTFDVATTNTSDLFANTSEAFLVTSDGGNGTAGGDVPPVGSVFNVLNLFGNDTGFQDVYSAIPGANGDTVSNILVTPFGDVPIPVSFDAAAVHSADVPLAGGYDAVPGTETLTGIGGVPPLDVVIQGTQPFDVSGTPGGFDADVSTASNPFGLTDEALLVTSDSGTAGAGAGDVPPVGSEFQIFTFGDSGFESILADLASPTPGGADVISDTLVTPLGDFTIPIGDALAGLGPDSFLDPLLASLPSLF